LNLAGLQTQVDRQAGTIYAGIEIERTDSGQARVKRVIPGSPAEKAKVDAEDILVSLNNDRVTFDGFRSRLHAHRPGEVLKLSVLRGERLLTLDLTPIEYQEERWNLVEASRTTPDQIQFRKVWLGAKN
jgi:predicted metalloprotease with PDZ domain